MSKTTSDEKLSVIAGRLDHSGNALAREVLADRAVVRSLVEALPECQCCRRKGTRVWEVDGNIAEFCDEHTPDDWYEWATADDEPSPIGYEYALLPLLERMRGWDGEG